MHTTVLTCITYYIFLVFSGRKSCEIKTLRQRNEKINKNTHSILLSAAFLELGRGGNKKILINMISTHSVVILLYY